MISTFGRAEIFPDQHRIRTVRLWFVPAGWKSRALRRRSQKSRLNWERFNAMLRRMPLPSPRITVQLWGNSRESPQRRSRMVEIS